MSFVLCYLLYVLLCIIIQFKFNKYLSGTFCVVSTMPGARDTLLINT